MHKNQKTKKNTKKTALKLFTYEYLTGTIDLNKSHNAYLVNSGIEQDVFIAFPKLNTAMDKDIVRVKVIGIKKSGKVEGEVVEVLERANLKFVGTIKKNRTTFFLIPDNQKMIYDIFIPSENLNEAKDGEKVVVEILSWKKKERHPKGKVVRILGMPGNNDVEMHAILEEFGLPYNFDEEIENQANEIKDEIPEAEIKKRLDFRNITTFTIDPQDAKDFDDALSFEFLKNGNYRIGVHIADVSHYVEKDSLLDKEAYERATSVYLVDRVVPMLPERLSNFICSLRPNEEKLCFSVIFEIDKKTNIVEYNIDKTIIKSDRRFTYEEAQKIIEEKEGDFAAELQKLNELAKILKTKRLDNGAFNFEHFEVKFILDEKANPINVYFKESNDSNYLIEEFMLLANKYVAMHVGKKKKDFVYRVHAEPDLQKLEILNNFVKKLGYKIDKSNKKKLSKSMNKLITNVAGKSESNIIENLAVRAMAKAIYDSENIGHYGLAFDYYTHFTSPIRRYPDIMVHRLLYAYLKNKKENTANLKTCCKHCSAMEQLATQAERSSIKYKQVEYLQNKIGENFKAVISGVAEYGFFVELEENACEGLVHINTLKNDFYFFDSENFQIIGVKSNIAYRLGDVIVVKIINVNITKKQVDFEVVI